MNINETYLPIREGQQIADILRQDHELIVQLIVTCQALIKRIEALETAYMEDKLLGKAEDSGKI